MKIEVVGGNYGEVIKNFFDKELELKPSSEKELLEIVTEILINTNQYRATSRPSVETQFEIRKVIRHSITNNLPVPILMPWGGMKPDGGIIDIAELMAFKILNYLNKKIQNIYEPGLAVNVRLEDVNAYWLFRNEMEYDQLSESIETYIDDMKKLRRIMGLNFMNLIPESNLMFKDEYIELSKKLSKSIKDVMTHELCKEELLRIGWKGDLPEEQIKYYSSCYERLYPNDNKEERIERIADYFAGSLARYQMDSVGYSKEWKENGFISLKMFQPIPGAPSSLTSKDLYYRPIPKRFSEYVMPPWRSKGYLFIDEKDEIIPKITSFHDKKPFEEGFMDLYSEETNHKLRIRADMVFKQ